MGKRTFADELADLSTALPSHDPAAPLDELDGANATLPSDQDLDDEHLEMGAGDGRLRLRAAVPEGSGLYAGTVRSRSSESDSAADLSGGSGGGLDSSSDVSPSVSGSDTEADALVNDEDDDLDDDNGDNDGGDNEILMQRPVRVQQGDVQAQDALEEADAEALASSAKRRRLADAAQGQAVQRQLQVWEALLEIRILLQKPLNDCHRLPQADLHAHVQGLGGTAGAMEGFQRTAAATLHDLLELHAALAQQHPGVRLTPAATQKQPAASAGQCWQSVSAARAADAGFSDDALDTWHRRVMLGQGSGAVRANLKTLGQGISAQVAAVLQSGDRLTQRSRMTAAARPRVLCDGQPVEQTGDIAADERDAQTFTDTDFYSQLLQEFLAGRTSSTAAFAPAPTRAAGPKRRKQVDRRASKGRRLRFDVQEKLVNFMTPVEATHHIASQQIFQNLFGQKAS